nr:MULTISPECIES: hypothetical protein [Symbiopectobacterium]
MRKGGTQSLMNIVCSTQRCIDEFLVLILGSNDWRHEGQRTQKLMTLRQDRDTDAPHAGINFTFRTGITLLSDRGEFIYPRFTFEHVAEVALQNVLANNRWQMSQ